MNFPRSIDKKKGRSLAPLPPKPIKEEEAPPPPEDEAKP